MSELAGAAKAAHEKKVEKEKGNERLPGFSTAGRFPNLMQKDRILAQPICPNSQIRGRMVNGHYEPPVINPGDENCQLAGGKWWVACEAKGHDPYFANLRRIVTKIQDVVDDDGDLVPVEKKVVVKFRILNVTALSTSKRVNSGGGVRWKKRYFGFKEITDFGFGAVCDMARCQEPVKIQIKGHGAFCSDRHAARAAVNESGTTISLIDQLDTYAADEAQLVRGRRMKELGDALILVRAENEALL